MNSDWLVNRLSRVPLGRLATIAFVRGGVTLANLAIFAVLGNGYGIDAVGQYASYLAGVILLGSLFGAGLPEMLMRRVSAAGQLSDRSLRTIRTPYWVMALMLAMASVVPSHFLFAAIEMALPTKLPAFAALGPGAYVFALMISEEYRGRGRAEASLIAINFGTILAPLGGLSVAVIIGVSKYHVVSTLIGIQIFASLTIGIVFAVATGICLNRWKSCLRVWRNLRWIDLFSMALMRLLSAGAAHITVLIVGAFGAPALAGFVAISTRLAGLAATYTGIVNAAFARRIGAAFRSGAESSRLFLQTSLLSTLGVGALMFPIILLPNAFLGIFGAGTNIVGAALALQILAASRILRAAAGVSDLFLLVSGRAHLELLATLSGLFSLLILLVLLPPSALGVSLALAVAAVIHGMASAFCFILTNSQNVG